MENVWSNKKLRSRGQRSKEGRERVYFWNGGKKYIEERGELISLVDPFSLFLFLFSTEVSLLLLMARMWKGANARDRKTNANTSPFEVGRNKRTRRVLCKKDVDITAFTTPLTRPVEKNFDRKTC